MEAGSSGPSRAVPAISYGLPSSSCSWNGRGLLHSDPIIRRKKMREVLKLADKHSIVFLFEMHGTLAEFEHNFQRYKSDFTYFSRSASTIMDLSIVSQVAGQPL